MTICPTIKYGVVNAYKNGYIEIAEFMLNNHKCLYNFLGVCIKDEKYPALAYYLRKRN